MAGDRHPDGTQSSQYWRANKNRLSVADGAGLEDARLSNSLLTGRQESDNVLASLMTRICVSPTRLAQWDMNGGRRMNINGPSALGPARDRAQLTPCELRSDGTESTPLI